MISLCNPALLHLKDGPFTRYGASQTGYRTDWQRKAGCGPTVCSHLLWYLARTRAECAGLCSCDGTTGGFLSVMEEVWEYVTPGKMGVNTTSMFTQGAVRYGQKRGVSLSARVLEVPLLPGNRPDAGAVFAFLSKAISEDLPVAFLNLSNGALKNLESWHWVTLVSVSDSLEALMYDQGASGTIDLALWLKTTARGGGFVALEPDAE